MPDKCRNRIELSTLYLVSRLGEKGTEHLGMTKLLIFVYMASGVVLSYLLVYLFVSLLDLCVPNSSNSRKEMYNFCLFRTIYITMI